MTKSLLILLLIIPPLFNLTSCDENNPYVDDEIEKFYENGELGDGIYCADIEYFDEKAEVLSVHTVNIKVRDNQVVVIYFINQDTLDDVHLNSYKFDEYGTCTVSDLKGKRYEIEINGEKCEETDFYQLK